MEEPPGVSERRSICTDGAMSCQVGLFQRLMRRQMCNPWGGRTESSITESVLVLGTHTYIQTLRKGPAMIICSVDVPWPLLTYLRSFRLVPCLLAPAGRDGEKVIFQLVFYFLFFNLI